MQNSNDWLGGYVRWFTGAPANNAYPRSVIFFPDDGMTVVEQGPFDKVKVLDDDPEQPGVARVMTTPSYVSVAATAAYDAEIVIGELKRKRCGRVGWVNPAGAYFKFGHALESGLADIRLEDVTDAIDQVKAIKSAEERELIRATAALQDKVMAAVLDFIRPGLRDFEVAAFAQYQANRLGSEQGIFISSSAPPNKAAVFRPPHELGRKIDKGDVFTLLVETNGPGGFYTEIGRAFVLGAAPQALREGLALAVDAQRATLERLKPGARCADVAKAHDAYMTSRGYPEERRLFSHGQGYDMVERPLIRRDETMTIAEGMSIVVHPGYVNEEVFATVCDNYLIGADGPGECLHQTPKQIFEV
jgi:Xaa-Pro aminopeptidase